MWNSAAENVNDKSAAIDVVIENDQVEWSEELEKHAFLIKVKTGGYSIQSKSKLTYIGASSKNSSCSSTSDDFTNSIEIDSSKNAIISLTISGTTYKLQYNSNQTTVFRYYSGNQKPVR